MEIKENCQGIFGRVAEIIWESPLSNLVRRGLGIRIRIRVGTPV